MAEIPVTPEVADFIVNTLKATRTGALDWEAEGQKQLIAPLSEDYRLELREVADLDGVSDEPDHLLTLFFGDRRLFTVDRRDVSAADFHDALGETVEYSYTVFSELWRRAYIRALHLGEHLTRVNKALQERLK
jgi:hypothetical protein